MNRKTLAGWLRAIILGVGGCGLLIYLVFLPDLGHHLAEAVPEYASCLWPWLIFLWFTAIPCYVVLVLGWKITGSIRADRFFTPDNGRRFRLACRLALGDSGFLTAGCILYWLLGMAHPSMVIICIGISLVGCAAAVVAEAMAQLTDQAAALQEQSDWTI